MPLLSMLTNCLRSKRSEVRILSGVPLFNKLALSDSAKTLSERLLLDFSVPGASPLEVCAKKVRAGVVLAADHAARWARDGGWMGDGSTYGQAASGSLY